MTRLVAEGTVDERIVEMQNRKEGEIGGVLGGRVIKGRLEVEDLIGLFGLGREGAKVGFIVGEGGPGKRRERFGEEDGDGEGGGWGSRGGRR